MFYHSGFLCKSGRLVPVMEIICGNNLVMEIICGNSLGDFDSRC